MDINAETVTCAVGIISSILGAVWRLSFLISGIETRLNQKISDLHIQVSNHLHTQVGEVDAKLDKLAEFVYRKVGD